MMQEDKIRHLEMIENVINRLANNSFLIKGWAVTLAAAVVALSGKGNVALAFLPIVSFWILDGYFLRQERLFRSLYEHVRTDPSTDFSMHTDRFERDVPTVFELMIFRALMVFWLPVLGVLIAVIIIAARVNH